MGYSITVPCIATYIDKASVAADVSVIYRCKPRPCVNTITFKRTRSLSSAVCFKYDSKCNGSTSGRKPVTGNGLCSDIDFLNSYITWNFFAARCCFSTVLAIFHCTMHMRSFDNITTSSLKSDVIIYLNSAQPFSYKDAVISDAQHCFRRLYDDNVCACAVVH